jgi:signal transduction histidine kinase
VIAELEQDAERLARLADDLLVLSREETDAAVPAEHVYLDELAAAVADGDGGIEIVAPEPVVVRGDRAALERALDNLVQNGRRYGPAEGRITIHVRSDDGLASVTVADEGEGLQPYEADRAFERFWRGHHGKPGSGLGLAIVRATAERHGGRVYAEGARFTIELPALRDLSEFDGTTQEETPEKGSP